MSSVLIWAFAALCVVIAGAAVWERKWPTALYFLCAAGINLAVLWMNRNGP